MRQSIYARHGAAFDEPKFAQFFSNNEWYSPRFTLDEVQEKLTKMELENIDLMFIEERKKLK